MRREDIFMDLIGELDDNYIALAMSRPKRRGIVSETSKVTFLQPVEISHEVSKKDMRIYWITRTLGMAAVTVLIVGAVFLLWKNWDKIMVRDPDRPPVVTTDITTVTDPSIITTDIDDSGKSNAPSVTFEEMKQMLYYKGNCIQFPCMVFDITRLDSLLTASAESGEGSSMFFIKRNDELICTLTVATSGTDIDIPEGKQLISLAIRSGEDFSLFDGKIKLGTTLDEVKALLGEPMHNDEYPDYNYKFTSGGETIAINDMRFDDDGKLIQMPDISYIGLPADSLYAHKTDNSMPEDPFPYNDPDYYYWFYGMWSRNFSSVRNSVGNLGDPEKRATLDSINKERYDDTPYTLYDNLNLYWYCNWLGISANELCEAIENDNATYMKMQEEIGYIPDDALYTDEEISVLRSGSRKDLIEQFATEYDIICGEHVFNPKWLYYHILAEYFDAGITPEMVKEKYPLYKQAFYEGSWKMTDEAWAAFDAKLQKYMGMISDVEEPDSNEEKSDPFGQITDTSMPRPFPEWHDTDNAQFEFQWKTKAVGAAMDCRGRENYDEWNRRCMSIRTPYRLDDNNNVAGGIKWFGITAEEIDEYFEKRNARWQESLEKAEERGNEGAIMNCRNEIFSEEEINALKSGNDAEIIALFISDYSIWLTGSNYVISPEWLYYHTAEDYAAIGIEPQMIAAKIPLFEKTFTGTDNGEDLDEKSWELFKAKLTKYVESAESADRLSVKTDSMPEPFAPAETNWEARDFFSQWDRKFGDHNSAAEIYLTELSGYETDHGGEQGELYPADTTPYTLDDSANDYNHARIMGHEGDALAELIRKRNETYSKNLGMADYIYSEDEIKLLISGSRSEIIDRFSSEFSIVVGEYIFSPRWLYYHTAEDYQAAGITRQMIGKMLKKYEGLGLTDEAWKAFREKLILYYTYGVFDEASVDKTYIIDTENCKLSGDSAFEILENVYYGEWEIKEPFEPYKSVLSLTYQQDPFANGMIPVTGMFETDEIYALAFTNGGAAGCLLIEKSAPDVMYWTDILPSGVGLDVVKFGYGLPGTYINRKPAVPEIKSGELSLLGLKKLFHTYGKAFEDSFAETLEKDRTAGIETGMGTAYAASKDVRYGELPSYLADYTDDSVNMLLPYYCEKDSNVTTFYAVKSFMKNYKGEWDAVDIWTDEGISPRSDSSKASGSTIPEGMLGTYDLDALTAKVFSEDSTFMSELNKYLDGINDNNLAEQYKRAFTLGTAGCRDMEDFENTDVLRQFYGDDYERSGKRAVVYSNSGGGTDDTSGNSWVNAVKDHLDSILSDGSGSILGKSSGYSFTSVMNAYLRTFSASYINDVFPGLPLCRYGDELFYRDASMVIPDCHYEFNYNGSDDRAVLALIGYAKDNATGEKTDEIIYSIEAIFDKTTDGWKCSRFGFSNRSE